MISEESLRDIVERVLTELKTKEQPERKQRKIYMLCTSHWDDRFPTYLKEMTQSPDFLVYPVIPLSWKEQEYEDILHSYPSCGGILYHFSEKPLDLEENITVLPVVPRDIVVKTALCLTDTYETDWIASCIETGGRVIFLRNGLVRFTGREPEAFKNQILSYYRTVLTYGVTICSGEEAVPHRGEAALPQRGDVMVPQRGEAAVPLKRETAVPQSLLRSDNEAVYRSNEKKQVITAANIEQLAVNGVLCVGRRDIVTDLALDRAKYLNIILKKYDCEVNG